MNVSKAFSEFLQHVSEAVARLFSPNDDRYPMVGVQPFEGEPYKQGRWAD
jgi:hypothetical protein